MNIDNKQMKNIDSYINLKLSLFLQHAVDYIESHENYTVSEVLRYVIDQSIKLDKGQA